MKGQTYFIFALLFAVLIAVFAVINVNDVQVNYLFGNGEAPLVLVILFSTLVGGIITAAFGSVKLFRLQREVKALRVKLAQKDTDTPTEEMKQIPKDEEEIEDKENEQK
ncbi:lipopolysaccharide assembly protein LapA domain-containing protein [Bacillaceae bacterium S4-13-58]